MELFVEPLLNDLTLKFKGGDDQVQRAPQQQRGQAHRQRPDLEGADAGCLRRHDEGQDCGLKALVTRAGFITLRC